MDELVRYDDLLELIDQQADTTYLPVGQSHSNVQSNHTLRRRRNCSLTEKMTRLSTVEDEVWRSKRPADGDSRSGAWARKSNSCQVVSGQPRLLQFHYSLIFVWGA
jgi:hypothetical protein